MSPDHSGVGRRSKVEPKPNATLLTNAKKRCGNRLPQDDRLAHHCGSFISRRMTTSRPNYPLKAHGRRLPASPKLACCGASLTGGRVSSKGHMPDKAICPGTARKDVNLGGWGKLPAREGAYAGKSPERYRRQRGGMRRIVEVPPSSGVARRIRGIAGLKCFIRFPSSETMVKLTSKTRRALR